MEVTDDEHQENGGQEKTEEDKLAEILKKHTEEIKKEVLADNILIGTMSGYTKEWDINGEKGMFGVEKTTD